tara:strand:- start:4055 stop:4933 length:879 start_codon:yes stop_codon:yes gene_type:complete
MDINLIKEDNLNIVIEFLSKGFSWSTYRSNKVKNFVRDANSKNIDFYGFYLTNSDNEILGAILSPLQGKYLFKEDNFNVVNLMSWYVLPKYRGMESLRLAKYAIDYLDSRNFIITNFTPNKVAKKVFINFGFKDMEILTRRFYFFEGYKYFLYILFKKKYLKKISLPSGYSFFNENCKGGVLTYKLNLNDNEIIFKSIRVKRKKKIFGLEISYPILYITPLKGLDYVLENFEFFCKYISFYFFVLFIEIDIEKKYLKYNSKILKRFKSRYILFTREKYIKFFPFFGSELSLK